jgi:hypothetical protein
MLIEEETYKTQPCTLPTQANTKEIKQNDRFGGIT